MSTDTATARILRCFYATKTSEQRMTKSIGNDETSVIATQEA